MSGSRLVAVLIVASLVLACVAAVAIDRLHSPAAAAVTGVAFHFSSDFPAADDSTYVMDDEGVESFRDLLDEFGIDPATYDDPNPEVCPGADWVEADVSLGSGGARDLRVDACMTGEGSFEQRGVDLFGWYVHDHVTENYPNSAITSITFRQSRSIDGWDYATYTQDDPQELARFADLLDEFSLVWSERVSNREPSAVDPCNEAIVTHVTVRYGDVDPQVAPLPFDACRHHDVLTLAVTDLFSEWRETLRSGA